MKIHKTGVERWLFNVGAVLGSLCLVLAAVTLLFGLKPLILTSGSMAPAIPTGALAFAVPAAAGEVSPGDVVSVVSSDGVRITHRVAAADPASGLVLKGDANAVADLHPYTGASVDRVLFSIPGLGYVASWLTSPWLFGLGALLCAYLIYVAFFRRGDVVGNAGNDAGPEHPDGETEVDAAMPGTRRRTWLGAGAIVTALALAAGLGLSSPLATTQAAFSAEAQAASAVSASVMPAPGALTCAASGSKNRAVDVSWAAPQNAPVAVKKYKVTVSSGAKSNYGYVEGATTKNLSLDEPAEGLLGGLIDLLGNLLDFLLGGAKAVDVSVVAIYPNGWESAATAKSGIASIAPVLLSQPTLKCK